MWLVIPMSIMLEIHRLNFNHESKFQRNFPAFSFTIIPNKLMFNEYV